MPAPSASSSGVGAPSVIRSDMVASPNAVPPIDTSSGISMCSRSTKVAMTRPPTKTNQVMRTSPASFSVVPEGACTMKRCARATASTPESTSTKR